MYSKQQASQLRQEFWTAFGLYMAPILSAEGEKVNWINYKTGEKNVYFRMQADNKSASLAIEITHKDADIRQLYFEQFEQFKNILQQVAPGEWHWVLHVTDEDGKQVSRIYTERKGLSVLKKEDWPELISFFKAGILSLDAFWSQVKYPFEALR